MKMLIKWLDQNILTVLVGILLVIVPLYPKIPLAELIEGYIVRLRFEDILILFSFFVYLIQLARGKISLPKSKIAKAIYIYLLIGFLSSVSALFITETVPYSKAHVLKLAFHWFRRVEYFSLFFLTYSAVRSRRDLKLMLKIALLTLAGVVIYGIGQKYLYWPAFSTMNREFSKGVRLYLQPNTRLFSTFGGHYDLAAYLMFLLSFIVPLTWFSRKGWRQLALIALSLFSYWALVLTTSRTSFIGYLVAITLASLFIVRLKGFWWTLKRYIATITVSLIIMFFFSDLLERFTQIIPNRELRETIVEAQKQINQPLRSKPEKSKRISELPSLLGFLFQGEEPETIIEVPEGVDPVSLVATKSDTPPSPTKPTSKEIIEDEDSLPADVTEESEENRRKVALDSGKKYDGPSYSENALKYGLSMGIRLDVLWPQALAGLKRNPLLGSGYSTLVKTSKDEFTYAESTDNDYLRMLGETGILGALAFMFIIYLVIKEAYLRIWQAKSDNWVSLLPLGVLAGTVSLLVNAMYIDIFESSKIAYTFWSFVALLVVYKKYEVSKKV